MTTPAEQLAIFTAQGQMGSYMVDKMGLVSVKSFGAKGDGIKNDTQAIRSTLQYATQNGLKSIFFPHGTYKVDAPIGNEFSGFFLWGDNSSFVGIDTPINQVGTNITEYNDQFLGLIDAPKSFTGYSKQVVSVKTDESALEFVNLEDTFYTEQEVDAKENGIKARIDNHVGGLAEKHSSKDITFDKSGTTMQSTNTEAAIKENRARIDQIITTPISGEAAAQEMVLARGTFGTLPDRLDNVDSQMAENASKIGDISTLNTTDKSSLTNAIKEVKTQVNSKADQTSLNATNSNVSSLQTQVNNMGSGSPKGTYATLADLQTAFPSGTTGTYVVSADGKWYYWSGSAWTKGGTYQTAGLPDGYVKGIAGKNKFDKTKVLSDTYLDNTNGTTFSMSGYFTSDYIPFRSNAPYIVNYLNLMVFCDVSKTFISSTATKNGNTPANTAYLRLTTANDKLDTLQLEEGSTSTAYESFKYVPDYFDGTNLKDGSVGDTKLKTSAVKTDKIDNKSVLREKIGDSFLANFPYLDSTMDLNTALKDGTYVAINAINAPISGTLYVKVEGFGTISPTSRWIQQTAYTGSFDVYIRRIDTVGGTFGVWTKLSVLNPEVNPLVGKKIVFLGDSITDNGDYPERVGTNTGATIYNCGFGGTKMALIGTGNYDYFSFVRLSEAIKTGDYSSQDTAKDAILASDGVNFTDPLNTLKNINFSTLDYMVIFLGTNDYGNNGALIGTNTDTVGTTFKGAINLGISNILSTYPQIKIYFITPMFRARFDVVGDGKDSDVTPNLDGLYLINFVDAIKEVSNLNHLPVFDMYREGGINKYNYATYLTDGLHPLAGVGYQHVANKVSGFLISKH